MSVAHEFGIYLMGFSESDKERLRRVLRVSSGSVRQYVLTEHMEPREDKLYLVNADSDQAIKTWCKCFLNRKKEPEVPTAFAGKRKIKGKNIYHLSFPFKASQVINTFNTMTVKELDFIPELNIGEEMDDTNLSYSFLEKIVDCKISDKVPFKALVVDDSRPVRKQLEMELKLLGVDVELASCGEQAIVTCQSHHYDIIFLDVIMPGIDGYKVCKQLKKDQRTKATPIIMLTGKSSPFDKVRGSLSGCDSYLTKPLERTQFHEITSKYISEVKQEQIM